jgi:hypothetical protein
MRVPPSPAHALARDARAALEDALLSLASIEAPFDREGARDRLLGAIAHATTALDTGPLAPAHLAALAEGEARAREAIALLAAIAGGTPALATAPLAVAAAALREGHELAVREQLARRDELHGDAIVDAPAARPFRASEGVPALHGFARAPILPRVDVGASPPAPLEPPPRVAPPRTLAELDAFARAASSGALASRAAAALAFAEEPTEGAPAPLPLPYEPACEEVEVLRRLARSLLEDVAGARALRIPSPIETWVDQARSEARLLASLDALASIGPSALPVALLFHAEAPAPDPGRAFAVAVTLGSIEGHDAAHAVALLARQSAPEERRGFVDGLALASSPAIDEAVARLAVSAAPPAIVALALDVLHRRGATPDDVARRLAWRTEPAIAWRAARALGSSLPHDEAVVRLDAMIEAGGDDDLRIAAIEAELRRGHVAAIERLRAIVDGPPSPLGARAIALLALVGDGDDVGRMARALEAAPTPELARAIGRFGHVGLVPQLLALVERGADDLGLAAAEALARLLGAGPREEVEATWDLGVPLDPALAAMATLPRRRVVRAAADARAFREVLAARAGAIDPRRKLRRGAPLTALAIVDEIAEPTTPPPDRVEAARELALLAPEIAPIDLDGWVARQLAELAAARALLGRTPRASGAFYREARSAAAIAPRAGVALATEAVDVALAESALPFHEAHAAAHADTEEVAPIVVETADAVPVVKGPDLPFVPAAAAAPIAPSPSLDPAAPPRPSTRAPAAVAAFLDRVLGPPVAPARAEVDTEELDPGRRRRLVRFDPETGAPLAEPRWEDVEPDDGAR